MYKSVLLVCLMGFIFLSSDSNEASSRIHPDIIRIYPGENITGAENAPVTLIVYINFECPYCASFEKDIVPKLKADFIAEGKLRMIFRVFPPNTDLSGHAMLTSELAACSATHNRFWEMTHTIFSNQGLDVWENYDEWSQLSGGNEYSDIKACLAFHKKRYHVLGAMQRYSYHDIRVTPTVFINNHKMEGIRSYEEYNKVIKDVLNE